LKKGTTIKSDELADLIPKFNERGMDLGIKRMQMALNDMGQPCADIPAIQVVGTNGKGSITSFIQSSLKAAGVKTGVTTSPHLSSWCERISINGNLISTQEFRQRIISLKPIIQKHHLTPFELVIATAFDHFAENHVDLLVLEVGLGGRLDATTAHSFRPIIAIASIGLDHCEHLGKTLKEVAKEKAAVISDRSIVITATQHPDVVQILEETVHAKQAEIQWVAPLSNDWELGLNGEVQRKNAAVAKGALERLKVLGWNLNEKQIRQGLALAKWPGRLQKATWNGFPLILDGAHNPHAAKQLSKERSRWNQQANGINWIIGIQRHKDAPNMLRHLIQSNDIGWIVPVPGHDSWSERALSKACPELTNQLIQGIEAQSAFYKLLKTKKWPTPPPIVVGSLYLIGDLLTNKVVNS